MSPTQIILMAIAAVVAGFLALVAAVAIGAAIYFGQSPSSPSQSPAAEWNQPAAGGDPSVYRVQPCNGPRCPQ